MPVRDIQKSAKSCPNRDPWRVDLPEQGTPPARVSAGIRLMVRCLAVARRASDCPVTGVCGHRLHGYRSLGILVTGSIDKLTVLYFLAAMHYGPVTVVDVDTVGRMGCVVDDSACRIAVGPVTDPFRGAAAHLRVRGHGEWRKRRRNGVGVAVRPEIDLRAVGESAIRLLHRVTNRDFRNHRRRRGRGSCPDACTHSALRGSYHR